MINYKLGNIYSLEHDESLEKQIEECAQHMFLKYGKYPDMALVNSKHAGEKERAYKTASGKKIKIVPDDRQGLRSFVLAVTGP